MAQVMSKTKAASQSPTGASADTTATASKAGTRDRAAGKPSEPKTATQARKARSSTGAKAATAKAKTASSKSTRTKATTTKTTPAKSTATGTSKRAAAAKQAGSSAAPKEPVAKGGSRKPTTTGNGALSKSHARLSRKMLDEREKLVRQAEELEAEQAALAADPDAAEMSGDIESGDCVASREREVDLRVSAHIEDMIAQIDRATERLHTGTYGECARCHNRIPAARLEALPYAELCVSCQEKHERLYY